MGSTNWGLGLIQWNLAITKGQKTGSLYRGSTFYFRLSCNCCVYQLKIKFCFFLLQQSEPNVGALIALIQKLHLCINQLEQVIDRLNNNFFSFLK